MSATKSSQYKMLKRFIRPSEEPERGHGFRNRVSVKGG